jgi:hypothetical protein
MSNEQEQTQNGVANIVAPAQEKLVRPPRSLMVNQQVKSVNDYKARLMIGTPMTGLVRAEWVNARYLNQIQPTNWGCITCEIPIYNFQPVRFQVADAENLIVAKCLEAKCEWLLIVEHDNVLPPATFVRLNEYMVDKNVPVVSALYFTKSVPPEPMVYKDFGFGYDGNWKMGDKVWVKGVPLGCTLIHSSLLKAMWDESPEYSINGQIVRRVFHVPNEMWFDVQANRWQSNTGTSDLHFCKRLVEDKIFEKAGWPEYQQMEYPILVDTNIFVKHITDDGVMYPLEIPDRFLKKDEDIHMTLNLNTVDGAETDRKIKMHFKVNGIPAGADGRAYYAARKAEILAAVEKQLDESASSVNEVDGVVFIDGSGVKKLGEEKPW